MPIVTLAQLRGRGRGRRGRGRGRGRVKERCSGQQEHADAEPEKPFQGSSHSLRGERLQADDLHDPELDGLGVFATAYPATYEDGVEHLQSVQDEAAINALMERLDAEQGNVEKQKLRNDAPVPVAADCGLQTAAVRMKQRSKEQGQATAGSDVIDLCDSDAEDAGPARPQPNRSCSAARLPAVPSQAAASTSGRSQPQQRPSVQQATRGRTWGAQAGGLSSSDWMFGGDGAYVPDPNAAPDMRLRLWEVVHVLDTGLVPHCARALLDSGNGGCTLIKRDLARQLGLVDEAGWPTQAGTRTTTVHGVVAGASEKIPLMNLTYELRGKEMHVTVGVTNAKLGCDLLISQREISQFISDGFIFDVR